MKLNEIINKLNLKIATDSKELSHEVAGAYVGDLLSDVMANCKESYIWITMQVHPNIVAVASMKEVAGIVLVNGRQPQPETLKKANDEKINLLISDSPAFELAGKLYEMGLGKGK
jgi:hypothetical protein